MVQRWLCITTRANDKISQQKELWGVSKRYEKSINKLKLEDTLVMYIMQEIVNKEIIPSAISGIYRVISSVYEDSKSIFETPHGMGDEKFPIRVKIKPIEIFREPVPFKPLIPKMAFIKNKEMWSGSIRTAMREIPEEDYQKIISAKDSE